MATNRPTQSAKNVLFHQPKSVINHPNLQEVLQDKHREKSVRAATAQPAPREQVPRTRPLHPNTTRSTNGNVPKTRTVQLNLWVSPREKAEVKRLAEQEGLSASATGRAFMVRGMQAHIDMHYSATLPPIIENAIRKEMRGMANRFAWLLVRVAFDTGQTRAVVNNLLSRQAGVTDEILKNILARAQQIAKGNITRRTPQIKELVEAVEKWLTDTEQTS
jgi:hypothetical protein